MNQRQGFTLIELLVVIVIIGILASFAMPSYNFYVQKKEVAEAMGIASTIKDKVTQYYLVSHSFPIDNDAAAVPAARLLIANRVTGVEVEEGAIHITLGNKASAALQQQVLSFRPAVVTDSPESPISWLCGHDTAVDGMEAVGENRTTLANKFLPFSCRDSLSD